MRNFLSSLWRSALLPAFLLGLLFLPPTAFAVVGDVTLTGLPPNTSVSLTNEETKEKVEQKTDERGFVVIPMTGKNWQSGRHSVACQVDGKPVSSRIFLRDGVNRVDLTALTLAARPLDPAKRQKVDEALKQSNTALKADPKNSQALLTQGSALNRLGRHGAALSKLAQAAKLGSTHPALAFETGWSLMRLGMYREAIAQLERYEKMKPGLGQTSEFIGRSHLYMGELDKADAKFNEALKRDPNLASTTRFHQAILETLRKNPQAASKHIASLLKEAPNSPTAQIFKNALLQPEGAKPPAGAGGKDYRLSDPIKIQLPPTTAADVAAGVAKGVVGGLLGGLFGGGGREPEGPNLVAKPSYPETMLSSKDGKSKINLSGALVDGKPNIVMGVKESPGNGAPHLMLLQDKNCNVLQPADTSVTAIWEQWGAWRINVSWTKSYYENGRLVKQEKGGWSTPWNEFKIQVKDPSDLPGIWKDFNSKPFEGIREVMSTFDAPPGVPFNPADWNLITHATTDAGNNQLVTAPFVTGLGTDKDSNLIFKPMQRTACESAPPSAPLIAGPTTFPWTVGPYGITMAPEPKSTLGVHYVHRSIPSVVADVGQSLPVLPGKTKTPVRQKGPTVETHPEGAKVEKRPDVADYAYAPRTMIESRVRTETRPDGIKIESRPDGTEIVTHPDGLKIETRPEGTDIVTRPDGTIIETRSDGIRTESRPDGTRRTIFPDGSAEVLRPDGLISFEEPPQTAKPTSPGTRKGLRPPPQPTDSPSKTPTRTRGPGLETRPDGTKVETGPDGITTETRPDGTRITTYPDGPSVTMYPPGSMIIRKYPDGSMTTTLPDKTSTSYPDGSTYRTYPDGSTATTRTNLDGTWTTIRKNPDGSTTSTINYTLLHSQTTTKYPDGSTSMSEYGEYPDDNYSEWYTTHKNPDGSTREERYTYEGQYEDDNFTETKYPDGSKITTYSGGWTREQHPDGTDVMTHPDGTRIVPRPDGTRIVTRPAGAPTIRLPGGASRIETRTDGTTVWTSIDGTTSETRPDGSTLLTRPNGTKVATFPDGSRVEVGKDGSITFHDAPQTGQPPPQPADSPAPPSVLDFLDEAIVPS